MKRICSEMLIWRIPYIAQLCNKGIRNEINSYSRTGLLNTNISLNPSNLNWKRKDATGHYAFLEASTKPCLWNDAPDLPRASRSVYYWIKVNCYHVLLEHFMSLTTINDFTASDFHMHSSLTCTTNSSYVSSSLFLCCHNGQIIHILLLPCHNSFHTIQFEVASKNSGASGNLKIEDEVKWVQMQN